MCSLKSIMSIMEPHKIKSMWNNLRHVTETGENPAYLGIKQACFDKKLLKLDQILSHLTAGSHFHVRTFFNVVNYCTTGDKSVEKLKETFLKRSNSGKNTSSNTTNHGLRSGKNSN